VSVLIDPFDGRAEMTSEEYRSWLAEANQTVFVPPAPVDARPDWTTSEKRFMAKVVKYATEHGWRVSHTYNSANSEPGVPDLEMLRRGVLVKAELKVPGNKPTKDQRWWLDELSKVPGVEVFLWYPDMWEEIARILA
jgi:hypothetical protein